MNSGGTTPKRIRRTAEDARTAILDAAQLRVAQEGPAGLRLQQVAADAGMSHPTVLHHFGSREGLLRAVSARTVETMRTAMLGAVASGFNTRLVPAVFEAFRGGLAQQLIWLAQSEALRDADTGPFEDLVEALYARRLVGAPPGRKPERADTRNLVHLVVMAAFGDALIGPLFRNTRDADEERRRSQQFEDWLRLLIRSHISAN